MIAYLCAISDFNKQQASLKSIICTISLDSEITFYFHLAVRIHPLSCPKLRQLISSCSQPALILVILSSVTMLVAEAMLALR